MSLTLGALRQLVGFGLSAEQILAVAEAQGEPDRSAGAERQRRYRERKAARDVTSDVTPVTSRPPLSKEKSPAPPKETQPPQGFDPDGSMSDSPTKARFSPSKAELDAIWAITPRTGRERSSRKDLDRALTAAMRRGHDPGAVLDGLRAAYASPSYSGDHAKGVHRLIEADRWQSFTEDIAGLSNVVPIDPAQLAERQRLIAEWAEHQAAESHA